MLGLRSDFPTRAGRLLTNVHIKSRPALLCGTAPPATQDRPPRVSSLAAAIHLTLGRGHPRPLFARTSNLETGSTAFYSRAWWLDRLHPSIPAPLNRRPNPAPLLGRRLEAEAPKWS